MLCSQSFSDASRSRYDVRVTNFIARSRHNQSKATAALQLIHEGGAKLRICVLADSWDSHTPGLVGPSLIDDFGCHQRRAA